MQLQYMTKTQQNTVCAHLDRAKLKHTKARFAVLSVLLEARSPLTIEDIQRQLKVKVHTVTLYRMLKKFVESGIVYQTDLRTGKAYYEFQKEHHHHVTCTDCGLQEEVKTCVARLQNNAQKETKNFKNINTHSLEFFGVCNKCTSG